MPTRIEVPKMYKLYIGGKFTRTESERYTSVIDPKTKKKICNISRASRKDVKNAVVAARSGYDTWSAKTGYERGQILYRLAEMLEGRKDQLAHEITLTTLSNKAQASREVMKAIDRLIWYAGLCDKYGQLIGTVNNVQSGYFNFSIAEPTGIVGILLPEELPFLALVSRLCAVITSGNSCIIIPSESSPLAALTFSEISATSDVPAGVINILTGKKKELIPHLASHMDVNAFDYAESNPAYKKEVQSACAGNVKRFINSAHKSPTDYFNDDKNENIMQVQNFTELKTVWHTMGL
ncbi:MAG: aldehyde dehydrogenase family protein [Ignavibacteria bacterium]|nr:aldehyde dehydrogenase family protein [Ignavibacteria bacterium]